MPPCNFFIAFFYEDYPEIHVVAAGSLLEFALAEIPSFGVGRIRSMFMYPFAFDEFLMAEGKEYLCQQKKDANAQNPLIDPLHNSLIESLRSFLIVGGMPEAVGLWVTRHNYSECQLVHADILQTYNDDFAKYKKRFSQLSLRNTFNSVAKQIGNKFIYSRISDDIDNKKAKEALDLLTLAGLIFPVTHTAANGVPLGAETNEKFRKYLFLDTGLLLKLLGLDFSSILIDDTISLINKGNIAELFAGLEMLKYLPSNQQQSLYYWQRLEPSSQAEIDYVIADKQSIIIPIEVKAGTKGTMQSMFAFLVNKHLSKGIRTSLENFNQYDKIEIVPLYALSNLFKV